MYGQNRMKPAAIIGHTGFVGSTLCSQKEFEARFNRVNISTVGEHSFDTVVCAAAPGSMLTANLRPSSDLAAIEALIKDLDRLQTRRFVLISTIAVLADPAGGEDEGTRAFQTGIAYGRHRRRLEAFCEDRFEDCLVIRLPALFGRGLRKNFIFDLMNPVPSMLTEWRLTELLDRLTPNLRNPLAELYTPDTKTGMHRLDRDGLNALPMRASVDRGVREAGFAATQFHNPNTTYQFYDMARLWDDIVVAMEAGLQHLHLAVSPLRASQIHACLLGERMPQTVADLHLEDMRTVYAPLWGREGPYIEDADTVLRKLSLFFARERQMP